MISLVQCSLEWCCGEDEYGGKQVEVEAVTITIGSRSIYLDVSTEESEKISDMLQFHLEACKKFGNGD